MKNKIEGFPARIEIIDCLRGIAVFMVLLYHADSWLPGLSNISTNNPLQLLKFGFSGVDLFFVLSGFSLYYAWLAEEDKRGHVDIKNYFLRRFWRIYPPYLLAFLIPLISTIFINPLNALYDFLWHLPMIHNFSNTYFYGTNGPLWSLAVEAQFYLFFPLIVLAMQRFGHFKTVIIILLLSLIYRTGVSIVFTDYTYRQIPKPLLQGFLLSRMPNFILGMGIAGLWRGKIKKNWNILNKKEGIYPYLWVLIGVLILGATWLSVYIFRHSSMVWREFGFALGYSAIVYGMLIKSNLQKIIMSRLLVFTGTISYSLYLIHAPIMLGLGNVYSQFNKHTPYWWAIFTIIALIICYILSWAYFWLVEKPSISKSHTFK